MIAGGWDQSGNVLDSLEIIDLINPAFKYHWNDIRAARVGSVGGIVQNRPFICGGLNQVGKEFNNGIILQSHEEIFFGNRTSASSVVLNETRLWVCGGGAFVHSNCMNSSEFISLDQPSEDGPKLPFPVSNHCMVQVDSKTIYLIGGFQNHPQCTLSKHVRDSF